MVFDRKWWGRDLKCLSEGCWTLVNGSLILTWKWSNGQHRSYGSAVSHTSAQKPVWQQDLVKHTLFHQQKRLRFWPVVTTAVKAISI